MNDAHSSVSLSGAGVELPEVPQGVRGAVPEGGVPVLSAFDSIRDEARRLYAVEGAQRSIQIDATATVLADDRGGHAVKAWVWVPAQG